MTGITYISRDYGVNVSIVRLTTTDTTATATASGYLTAQEANIAAANSAVGTPNGQQPFTWYANDMILLSASDGDSFCTINSTFTTLVPYVSLAPTNQVVTINNATPGTIRAATFNLTQQATTMTSGNIVGVRGAVNMVGASGGFVYGVQGKVIPTGTLSGSVWVAGVFAQFDLSNPAVINAGQLATVWGDWGATGGTATNMTGARGFAFTNTTANILNSQFYMYGPATNWFELDDNQGAYGVTYFINAGTSAGSWGNATPPTPSKVLKISVNGTAYYLPLVAQNT